MSTAEAIHINPEEIPAFRREELARCVLGLMELAFSVPGEEERYQQWLIGYRERKRQREARAVICEINVPESRIDERILPLLKEITQEAPTDGK